MVIRILDLELRKSLFVSHLPGCMLGSHLDCILLTCKAYGDRDKNLDILISYCFDICIIYYLSLSSCPSTRNCFLYLSASVSYCLIDSKNTPPNILALCGSFSLLTYSKDPLAHRPLISLSMESLHL